MLCNVCERESGRSLAGGSVGTNWRPDWQIVREKRPLGVSGSESSWGCWQDRSDCWGLACLQDAAKAQDEVAELTKSSSVNCYSRKADIFRILVRVEENMNNFDRVRLERRVNRAGCGWQVLEGAARELGEPSFESRADAAPLVISNSYLSKTAVIKPAKGAQ
jgi:hypothetical protein